MITMNKIPRLRPLNTLIRSALFSTTVILAVGCSSDGGGSSASSVAVDSNVPLVMQSGQSAQGTVALVSTSIASLTSVDSTDIRTVTMSDSSNCSSKLTFTPSSIQVTVDGDAVPFQVIAPTGNCLHEISFSGAGITTSTSTSDVNVVQNAIVTVGLFNNSDVATTTVPQGGIIKVKFSPPNDWENVTGEQSYTVSSNTSGITYVNNPCTLTSPQTSACSVTATVGGSVTATQYTFNVTPSSTSVPADETSLPFTVISPGIFTFNNGDEVVTEVTLTIGGDPVTYTIVNTGEATITNFDTNIGDDVDKFDVTDPGGDETFCGDIDSLAANASCQLNLALSDSAEADATYEFEVTGDNASNSPAVLTVSTESGERFVAYKGTTCLKDSETDLVWYNAGDTYEGNNWNNLNNQFPQDETGEDVICGQTGWRMPTLEEYGCSNAAGPEACNSVDGGLITGWDALGACGGENCDNPAEYLNNNGFSSVQSTLYWSATDGQFNTFALTLVMSSGGVGLTFKDNGSSFYLLPVRSAW